MLSLKRRMLLSQRHLLCGVLTSESPFSQFGQCVFSKTSNKSTGSVRFISHHKSLCRNFSVSRPFSGTVATSSVDAQLVEIVESQNGEPELDWNYILDPRNKVEIQQNVVNRKGVGNIDLVHRYAKMLTEMKSRDKMNLSSDYQSMRKALIGAAMDLPNRSHPDVPVGDETNAIQLAVCGQLREFCFEPKSSITLAEGLGFLRTQNVGLATGPRSYYLKNDLAQLEEAVVNYTLDVLLAKNFSLISVPDLVSSEIIEGCGFKTTGTRTQIYKLNKDRHGDVCLAGTGEIPIAGFFKNQELQLSSLPQRLCTVSRCFRAETSDIEKERGLYRVHQFTKVEMFGVTGNETGEESEQLLKEILDIQRFLFDGLGLHFRILNMPSQELGPPAVQKFDMEAWLPARSFWGEISSASNCTDFQSRRLRIKYRDSNGNLKHCHTVNGTACAVPRILISVLENFQNQDGSVSIPPLLHPYMDNPKLSKTKFVDGLKPSRDYHFHRPL